MIVDFTPAARDDLAAIGQWIAQDNPLRAITFVDELIDAAEDLVNGLERFPEIDPRRYPGVRRRNHRAYRIYYRLTDDTIAILNIHRGRRRTPTF